MRQTAGYDDSEARIAEFGAVAGNLARAHAEAGDSAAARQLLEEAVARLRKTFGETHPSLAAAYNNLADLERRQGDYDAARELFLKALAICGARRPTATSWCAEAHWCRW